MTVSGANLFFASIPAVDVQVMSGAGSGPMEFLELLFADESACRSSGQPLDVLANWHMRRESGVGLRLESQDQEEDGAETPTPELPRVPWAVPVSPEVAVVVQAFRPALLLTTPLLEVEVPADPHCSEIVGSTPPVPERAPKLVFEQAPLQEPLCRLRTSDGVPPDFPERSGVEPSEYTKQSTRLRLPPDLQERSGVEPAAAPSLSVRVLRPGAGPIEGAELAFTARILPAATAPTAAPEESQGQAGAAGKREEVPRSRATPVEPLKPEIVEPPAQEMKEPPAAAPKIKPAVSFPPSTRDSAMYQHSERDDRSIGLRSETVVSHYSPSGKAPAPEGAARRAVPPSLAANPAVAVPQEKPVPTQAGQPVREISVRVSERGTDNVEVRLKDCTGELRVSVHARDTELASSLRRELPELVNQLEARGFETREVRSHGEDSFRGSSGEGNSAWTRDDKGERRQQHRQPEGASETAFSLAGLFAEQETVT